ncbi:MAG: hypothetical protein GC192_03140 [Bacteroidetes bacterium]|nr:hypothetical protein [Bacteroidota bacterium]
MVALFNCSQADFILVVITGLNSYFEYITSFTAFSPKYTATWGNEMRADLAAAEAMPTEGARDAESEGKRIELVEKAALARKYWQRLKRYIMSAYPENLVNIKLMAAGQSLYLKATQENWPATQMMLSAATRFMSNNMDDLTKNDNMPPTFPAEFGVVIANFRQQLSDYEDSKETIMVETQNRITALNDIHRRFMPMMLDGQDIYSDNEAVRKQFVFADVLSRVGGNSLAGLSGTVTDDATNLVILDAHIKLYVAETPGMEYVGATNEEGEYEVNCPSGTYTVTVEATGYNPSNTPGVVVGVSTVSRMNIRLTPAAVEG